MTSVVVEVQGLTPAPAFELEVGCEVEVVGSHRTVEGTYLGEVRGSHLVFDQTAGVVIVGDVQRLAVRRAAPVDPGKLLLLRALAAEATGRYRETVAHAEQIDEIVRVAHEEADVRDWCEEFDGIMDRLGLPRREREYSVRVRYSGSVVLSVTATSEDEALSLVSLQSVRDELENDGWACLDLDVDDTEVE